jgi:hypothetical protein
LAVTEAAGDVERFLHPTDRGVEVSLFFTDQSQSEGRETLGLSIPSLAGGTQLTLEVLHGAGQITSQAVQVAQQPQGTRNASADAELFLELQVPEIIAQGFVIASAPGANRTKVGQCGGRFRHIPGCFGNRKLPRRIVLSGIIVGNPDRHFCNESQNVWQSNSIVAALDFATGIMQPLQRLTRLPSQAQNVADAGLAANGHGSIATLKGLRKGLAIEPLSFRPGPGGLKSLGERDLDREALVLWQKTQCRAEVRSRCLIGIEVSSSLGRLEVIAPSVV